MEQKIKKIKSVNYIKTFDEYLLESDGDGPITIFGDVICKKDGKIL